MKNKDKSNTSELSNDQNLDGEINVEDWSSENDILMMNEEVISVSADQFTSFADKADVDSGALFEDVSEVEALLEDELLEGEGVTEPVALDEELDFIGMIEAILFASPKPLRVGDILEILGDEAVTSKEVSEAISSLAKHYRARKGGFRLENIRGGYQFQTVPAAGQVMEKMFSSRARPISRAAQETLAIIAYRQPVTRADIEFIRGVDAGSIMKNLLDRNLIKCTGRKEDSGRPMLFGTTDEFLQVYGLNSLADLPPLEAFQPSHEIMKNAMESIEGGGEIDGPSDFVGNYDDQAEDDDELVNENEDWVKPAVIHSEAESAGDDLKVASKDHVSSTLPKRSLEGAVKADKEVTKLQPEGVFLGSLNGGFEDDDSEEEY